MGNWKIENTDYHKLHHEVGRTLQGVV